MMISNPSHPVNSSQSGRRVEICEFLVANIFVAFDTSQCHVDVGERRAVDVPLAGGFLHGLGQLLELGGVTGVADIRADPPTLVFGQFPERPGIAFDLFIVGPGDAFEHLLGVIELVSHELGQLVFLSGWLARGVGPDQTQAQADQPEG